MTRVLLLVVSAIAVGCASTPHAGDAPAAIARALAADGELGGLRNHASETMPIARAVDDYATALANLDMRGCPPAFVDAMHRHREAWEASVPFFARFDGMRGELHDVFERIRARGGRDRSRLEEHEAAIWRTWAEVEAAADLAGTDR